MVDILVDIVVNIVNKYQVIVVQYVIDVGMKIFVVIVFWVVGCWLINLVVCMVEGLLS